MSWLRGGAGVALAFATTLLALPRLVLWLRRTGRLDHPGHRSLHDVPTPRGGGLAPVGAFVVGAIVALGGDEDTVVLVAFVAALAALGLSEDLSGVGARRRLAAQTALAIGATVALGVYGDHGMTASVVAAIWLIGFVNAFNFMDGVNGLATVQTVIAACTWSAVAAQQGETMLAWCAAVLAVAAVAFLPFNFPRARVFLGDVGSYGLGGAAAFMVVLGVRRSIPVVALAAPLSIFVADTSVTMLRRVRRREPLLQAHRDHVFQQLPHSGWTHTRITLVMGALMAASSLFGALALASAPWPVIGVVGVLAVVGAYLCLPVLSQRRESLPD